MYQIAGEDVLLDWLAREPDRDRRQAMLDWLAVFVEDPASHGQRVPGNPAPVYLAVTPVRPVTLKYLVADQFRAIKLIEFGRLP